MDKNNILLFIKSGLIAFVLLIFAYPAFTQVNTGQISTTVIDTVDDQSDLFDDNTNYKELYKDLNKDGDWVTIKESDLDNDSGEEGENVSTNVTNVRIINVWRPRDMGADWSPYSEGRWVYTYSGWVWSTDYDWGWAAYHYGRWVYNDIYGWIWMPGRYWAPSWVQWGYTSDYIGWYPIYPRCRGWHSYGHYGHHDRFYHGGRHHHWIYVNRNRFTEKINKNVIVDKSKNTELINGSKTKAIIKYNGSSLENVGPKVTAVEKNTGQKIQPKEINYSGSKGKIKVDDNNVTMYRNDISKTEINKQNGTKTKEVNNGTKTKDVNNGTKTKDVNNGTKTKDVNTGTKTRDVNNGSKTKDPNTGTKTKESNKTSKTKDSGTKSKDNSGYKNNEGNSNKGGNPNRESTRTKDSNSNKGNNGSRDSNSNKGNNGSRDNNSNKGNNGSRDNNSNKGNNDSKSSNRK